MQLPLPLQLLQTDAQPVGSKLSAEAPGEKESSQTCNGTHRPLPGPVSGAHASPRPGRKVGGCTKHPARCRSSLRRSTLTLRILLPSRGTGSTRCFRNAAVIFGLLPVFVFFLVIHAPLGKLHPHAQTCLVSTLQAAMLSTASVFAIYLHTRLASGALSELSMHLTKSQHKLLTRVCIRSTEHVKCACLHDNHLSDHCIPNTNSHNPGLAIQLGTEVRKLCDGLLLHGISAFL